MFVFAWLYFDRSTKSNDSPGGGSLTPKGSIPEEFIRATNFVHMFAYAPRASESEALFNMKDVRVEVTLADRMKGVVTEDEIRTKFELALRRNGVPISTNSQSPVIIAIEGGPAEGTSFFYYSTQCVVFEDHTVFRGNALRLAKVRVWEEGYIGMAGTQKIQDGLFGAVVDLAERFANDYLSANPKPK